MLRRVLRFFGAPRAWRVVALLVLGVLLSAATYAFQLPARTPLSRGFQPAELVGVYEIAAPRPGVYLQLSADGSARVEFLNLEDTGKGLRAMAGEKRKVGWWWVEQPEETDPVTALFARPRLCEQFKAAHPPQCREFSRDSAGGDLTIGEFGPFGQRVTTRYHKRTVRQAAGEIRNLPPADTPVESPAAPPADSGVGSDSSRATAGGSR
jgi:hypothetical protein